MAVFNEPTQWDTSLVVNGDTNVIPQSTPAGSGALSFDDGFPQITQVPLGAGGIAPDRKDFNAVMKLLGDAVFFMQNGGFWSYNPLFDYAVGRVVLYTDGFLYQCIQANGTLDPKAPTDSAYWQRIVLNSDIDNIRTPIGMSVEWNSDILPDNGLWENGAEYDQGDYNLLYNVIGYRFGSSTAVKATCSLGEAFIAGANGNNIRITVASSGASYLVTTYVSGSQVDQQLVTAITELVNHGYVVWNTSATLSDGIDVTMTGGADGTSFKVPDKRGRFVRTADGTYPLGAQIAEQLPNITGSIIPTANIGETPNSYLQNQDGAGALSSLYQNVYGYNCGGSSRANTNSGIKFDASNSSLIYTDNGKILPLSISKQSYIIYK